MPIDARHPRRSLRPLAGATAALAVVAAVGVGAWGAVRTVGTVPHEATVERELLLMGTRAALAVTADDRTAALAANETAVRSLEAAEARLSTWRDDSELARLNRAATGEPVELSHDLAAELASARACADATAGAFDPAVGSLVDLWDLRGAGRIPSPDEIAATLPSSRPSSLELHGTTARRRDARLRIEEGGWGKGAGIDAALTALAKSPGVTGAWLDLGGQAASLGEAPWTATLADPRDRRRPVVALRLAGGSLSTSGNSEHGLTVDGRRIGHLLDPRTGAPAHDFGTLSVWAPGGLLADCLSTGLYVMGPDAALAWAAAHSEVGVAVLEPMGASLRLRVSDGLAGRVEPLAPELLPELAPEVAPKFRNDVR